MLSVEHISLAYQNTDVLRDLTLQVHDGEILCLLGPSGCGKTTLLRIIAGLEKPDTGDVLLNSETILDIPVYQRMFGLMFQDFALFPHMNVEENIAFGLKLRKYPKQKLAERLREVLDLVGLQHMQHRNVNDLSGGEQQRVALARSLAPHPRLLMLDEPLGALDAALKTQLAVDLRRIIKAAGITSIYVTHDQHEAFSIGDRVVVMREGKIEQIDTPQALYLHPHTEFVARFLEFRNIFPIETYIDAFLRGDHECLPIDKEGKSPEKILLHPEKLLPQREKSPESSQWGVWGHVDEIVYLGDKYRATTTVEGTGLALMVTIAVTERVPSIGDRIWIEFNPEDCIPLY